MSKLTDTIAAAIRMLQEANVQVGTLQEQVNAAEARAVELAAENLILTQRCEALQAEIDALRQPATRKKMKPSAPLTGDIDMADVDIDASAVSRVFDINDGKIKRIKLRNVRITGATSVIEGWADGLVIDWENVDVDRVSRHGIYIESKAINPADKSKPLPVKDRIANRVALRNCRFGPSVHETPVRLMYGVAADIADCTFANDNKAKANIALRLHCHTMTIARVRSTGTKLGHAEWPAASIKCVDVDFSVGHFAMEGSVSRPVYVNCKFAA